MIQSHNQTEFENLNLTISEVQQRGINEKEKQLKEVLTYYPARLVFFTSFYDNAHHYERVDIYLKHDFLKLDFGYNGYSKQYRIWCVSNRELKNVTPYTITAVERKYNKPNNIGVLNKKKIEDWVKYYEKVHESLVEINKANKAKIDNFIKTLEPYKVSWSKDGKSGSILRNGVKYSFTIDETSYSENVELERYNTKHNLDYFSKISHNALDSSFLITQPVTTTKKTIRF